MSPKGVSTLLFFAGHVRGVGERFERQRSGLERRASGEPSTVPAALHPGKAGGSARPRKALACENIDSIKTSPSGSQGTPRGGDEGGNMGEFIGGYGNNGENVSCCRS